jgi:predicted TIM-barrel fold metal-dependent hydrolase
MAPAQTMVVDCDTHFWGPREPWEDYLEPRQKAAVLEKLVSVTLQLHANIVKKLPASQAIRGGLDPAERLKWMDDEGIHVNIIYPSNAGAAVSLIDDPDLAAAGCRAVNRWAAEFAAAAPARLKPCMVLPVREPERALAELRHAVDELGLEAVFATPIPLGRRWSDPDFDPLWAAMQDAGVVMTFHEFSRGAEGAVARPFYRDSYPMMYLCGHVVEVMLTAMDLILGGVLERFPRLQVGFIESHIAWAPGWLALMDDSFPRTSTFFEAKTGTGTLAMRPSDFFRRQMFVAGFPDDTWLPEFLRHIGAENLVLSTDYPHPQTRYGLLRQLAEHHPDLPADVRAKILGENARRIFRLDPDELRVTSYE